MAYGMWLDRCDKLLALLTEGQMTDDFPDYDWRSAWSWGEDPRRAVMAAVVQYE
jgi:hypothetical protein